MTTVGKAKLVGNEWHISAEPHVLIRLRRLFKGTDRAAKVIKVADTLEHARDIEWVCERWPLEVDPLDRLKARAARHREAQDSIAKMMAAGYVPRPFKLAIEPRDYQRLAAELALTMRHLLLADDLGLGKSASAICTLIEPTSRPALVVTLTHLPRQWEAEIAKFAPDLRVHRIREGEIYDIAERGSGRRKKSTNTLAFGDLDLRARFPDVVVTSYSKLVKWAPILAPHISSVIFDECQELRGHESQKYKAARSLVEAAELIIGLSATPFHNYGGELYNVLDCIAPDRLGTWAEFSATWCSEGEDRKKALIKDPHAFGLWAREQGLMLRRTRAEVARELPALTRVRHYIDADEKPIQAVEGRAMHLAKIILAHGNTPLERMEASSEISWLLRQATGIAKAPHAADFVRMLVETGEKVLVFAWHREVHSIIAERLQDLGVVLYTGEESAAAKEKSKQAFVSGSAKVLLMSLRSGAGIDGLQHVCRTTVHAELDWSPAVHNQDDGRVHRDGQRDPVMAYYLVSSTGSDPVVADVLGLKTAQIVPVLDPTAEPVGTAQIDPNHVRTLAQRYLAAKGVELDVEAVTM